MILLFFMEDIYFFSIYFCYPLFISHSTIYLPTTNLHNQILVLKFPKFLCIILTLLGYQHSNTFSTHAFNFIKLPIHVLLYLYLDYIKPQLK